MNISKIKLINKDNETFLINSEIHKDRNGFKYLGSVVTYDNDSGKKIKAGMAAGNK